MDNRYRLTVAETAVLDVLLRDKGNTFRTIEIAAEAGIPAFKIPEIVSNLKYKGYEISYRRGSGYYYKSNTWKSYALMAVIFGPFALWGIWEIVKILAWWTILFSL